jgi:inorganic pyrophosphatase
MSTIEVHIEIPYNSYVKYEFENNKLMVDRVLATAMHYPGNYGYIPNTLADDGDAIDVLIINYTPFFPGSYVQCRVLGMLITEDENGMDQKVIALPISKVDRENNNIKDIDDVNENTLSIIKDFFTNYKNNEPNKWVKCGDYENKEKTITFIQEKTLS